MKVDRRAALAPMGAYRMSMPMNPVAQEFGTSAVTSPSWGDALPGIDPGAAIAARNDEVLFSDQSRKGFVVLTLTRSHARADFHAVSTILAKPFRSGAFKSFRIDAATRVLREA